jgi:hypothetical protein
MNELTVANPFGDKRADAGGAMAQLERREEAEIMAMVAVAKRFPRDERAAAAKIGQVFERITLAEESVYSYSRGGEEVSDLTIRAMEAIALAWGNIDSSWAEISRGVGEDGVPYSLVEAKAWDLETTTRKRIAFIVRHWRDTRRGGYRLKEERDIYELCGNMAQRRVRACLSSLIPEDVKDYARRVADTTLATKAEVTPDALAALLEAFLPYGVKKEHIEARIQRNLDAMQPAQLVRMRKIYRSLKEGASTPSEWFEGMEDKAADDPDKARGMADLIAKAPAASAPPPAPAPAADDAPKAPEVDALLDKIKKAKNRDALGVHGGWITAANYPDEAVLLRLKEAYDARDAELAK